MFMFITILDTPMGMEISTRTGYEAYISELHKSNDDGTSRDPSTGGRLNMGLLRLARTLSGFIGKLLGNKDQGFEAFFMATCTDESIPRLKSAPEQAYLCRRSPRLSMLLRILDLEGAFAPPRPRFLLVCHWPMVAWMVEMFTIRPRLRTVSITAFKSRGS
ncbi:uncharacterized protein N7473_010260 [Penicillium subrubescens]|uniref:uncharacterized protein n=1 Tax=Penicillium subrubescens TaxID=1316194 RepID=UPI00254595FC|nr:uncharacterized protein N7473_010260 [Penicillium subrubescens]KAJ5883374.1 hypothetical protein N7473_010260 [Penicillium subrubescens]